VAGDTLYRILGNVLRAAFWGGELTGREALPEHGPAVFVANHAGALGPIAVTVSLPFRLYPWIAGEMLDWDKAGPYLRTDFVEPELHLHGRLAVAAAQLLCQFSVRLLRRIECLPVWSGKGLMETYRLSDEYLAMVRSLLIFPEDPAFPQDERCGMRPFKTGFARLGESYFELTTRRLQFFPIAVLRAAGLVRVGAPVTFNPLNRAAIERERIAHVLEAVIRRMIVGSAAEDYRAVPLPL
jgi:hypothetical protein